MYILHTYIVSVKFQIRNFGNILLNFIKIVYQYLVNVTRTYCNMYDLSFIFYIHVHVYSRDSITNLSISNIESLYTDSELCQDFSSRGAQGSTVK